MRSDVRVAVAVLTAVLVGTASIVYALECKGQLVSVGASLWEVHAICGVPAQIEDTVEVILKPVYDPHGHVAGHVPMGVPKNIWTYNFGSTRLIYVLTFLEGKLVKIDTGGYGH